MPFPTHIVAAGGLVEDGQGNILLVKTVTVVGFTLVDKWK